MTANENAKRKGKGFVKGCLITLLIFLVLLMACMGIGWSLISKEHQEAASLPLNFVDFNTLSDGKFHGKYAGGMYGWRVQECDVTVTDGKITNIQLLSTLDPAAKNMDCETLNNRVIQAQSLQVDTISSATLTSKAYLQCVENALTQAQHE